MERFPSTRQPDWDWWGRLWPTPGETLRRVGIEPGDTLVDVGSGNGYFTLPAARVVDPAQVYALDLDASLLDELEQLTGAQAVTNATAVHGDARSLADHLPGAVDVVLVANTFHGIDDPRAFLAEVDAVLAEDGRLVVISWRDAPREKTTVAGEPRGPPTERRRSPAENRRLVRDAVGMTATREVDVPPYHYGLVFER